MPPPDPSPASNFDRLRPRLPKICVAVTGTSAQQLQANSAALLPDFPFQEFRLDYLPNPAAALPALRDYIHTASATFLATCRPQRSGGRLIGSAHDELTLLTAAAQAGFPLVDLSLETAEELGPPALAQLRSHGAAVIVSFHDFHATPDLAAVLQRMRALAPDLCKVVSTAQTLDDSLTVLNLLSQNAGGTPIVALAMGEPGVPTRLLSPRHGAVFTFAAATQSEATAPGQFTARTLADLYRLPQITPATRLFGVAGDPIASSLSPLMLNTAFRETGLDAVYMPLKTASANDLLRAARALPLHGFSVTMPLKQTILPLLDSVDPLAARIGAVNTVRRAPDGTFHGANTDAAGIVVPLERRLPLKGARILVLGAGGAARAAVFGCLDRGANVFLYNRTAAKAEELARESGATAIHRAALTTEPFDILINSTPAGMRGNPLTLPVEEHELRAALVFDLVYNPTNTPLLKLAQAKGIPTIPGVEMFVHQGARQFEIWTSQPAPTEAMQAAVLSTLVASA